MGAGETAQWVKAFATQAWRREFDPRNLCKGGGKELSPQSCPLISTGTLWPMAVRKDSLLLLLLMMVVVVV